MKRKIQVYQKTYDSQTNPKGCLRASRPSCLHSFKILWTAQARSQASTVFGLKGIHSTSTQSQPREIARFRLHRRFQRGKSQLSLGRRKSNSGMASYRNQASMNGRTRTVRRVLRQSWIGINIQDLFKHCRIRCKGTFCRKFLTELDSAYKPNEIKARKLRRSGPRLTLYFGADYAPCCESCAKSDYAPRTVHVGTGPDLSVRRLP